MYFLISGLKGLFRWWWNLISFTFQIPQQSVTAVVFQDDNMLISAGAVDGNIKMWDLRRSYSTMKQDPLPYHTFPYPGTGTRRHGTTSRFLQKGLVTGGRWWVGREGRGGGRKEQLTIWERIGWRPIFLSTPLKTTNNSTKYKRSSDKLNVPGNTLC